MIWKRPIKLWEWLVLLVPAATAILAAQMAKLLMPPIPPLHLADGSMIPDLVPHIVRAAWIAFDVLVLLSCAIAWFISRGKLVMERLPNAFVIAVGLFFVNAFIAFGGCTLLGVANPDRNAFPPAASHP